VQRTLAALAHPIRLPILLALEQRPRTQNELVADLQDPGDQEISSATVKFALSQLRGAGLIEVVDERPTSTTLRAWVYATSRPGWRRLLKALESVGPPTG
jgi:DNA-binding PadR family transcriptional regulator